MFSRIFRIKNEEFQNFPSNSCPQKCIQGSTMVEGSKRPNLYTLPRIVKNYENRENLFTSSAGNFEEITE